MSDKTEKLISSVIEIYDIFQQAYCGVTSLDHRALVNAISDSQSDIERAGSYHGSSGADNLRQAAYLTKWVAIHRPICTVGNFPMNLNNANEAVSSRINASFCLFLLDYLTRSKRSISRELAQDLYYCFQFRYRMDPESIYLLLKHSRDV